MHRDDREYNNTINLSHYSMIYVYDNFFYVILSRCNFIPNMISPQSGESCRNKTHHIRNSLLFCFRKRTKLRSGYISLLHLPFLLLIELLLEGGILFLLLRWRRWSLFGMWSMHVGSRCLVFCCQMPRRALSWKIFVLNF